MLTITRNGQIVGRIIMCVHVEEDAVAMPGAPTTVKIGTYYLHKSEEAHEKIKPGASIRVASSNIQGIITEIDKGKPESWIIKVTPYMANERFASYLSDILEKGDHLLLD